MTPHDLESYLHERIPLSRAMAVAVRAATPEGVELFAPLAPNINHRDTVFGGSASAVAILAAWCALYVRMRSEQRAGRPESTSPRHSIARVNGSAYWRASSW